MALLKLDENSMTLNIIAGAKEEYRPTEEVEKLSDRVSELHTKMKAYQEKEQKFLKEEIIPTLEVLRKEIQDINETRYPELKQLREKQEAEKKLEKQV